MNRFWSIGLSFLTAVVIAIFAYTAIWYGLILALPSATPEAAQMLGIVFGVLCFGAAFLSIERQIFGTPEEAFNGFMNAAVVRVIMAGIIGLVVLTILEPWTGWLKAYFGLETGANELASAIVVVLLCVALFSWLQRGKQD